VTTSCGSTRNTQGEGSERQVVGFCTKTGDGTSATLQFLLNKAEKRGRAEHPSSHPIWQNTAKGPAPWAAKSKRKKKITKKTNKKKKIRKKMKSLLLAQGRLLGGVQVAVPGCGWHGEEKVKIPQC